MSDYITIIPALMRRAICTKSTMTDDEDRMARRIAQICSAKPVSTPLPLPPRCSQSRNRPERETVFYLASIYTREDTFIRCVVNDVSDTGACLTLKTFQALPHLVIVKLDHDGVRKRVRVVWQKGRIVGVAVSDNQVGINDICSPGAPAKAAR